MGDGSQNEFFSRTGILKVYLAKCNLTIMTEGIIINSAVRNVMKYQIAELLEFGLVGEFGVHCTSGGELSSCFSYLHGVFDATGHRILKNKLAKNHFHSEVVNNVNCIKFRQNVIETKNLSHESFS